MHACIFTNEMEERPFSDPAIAPTPASLKKVLKSTFEFYQKLMKQADGFHQEWNFSKHSGWMQKMSDNKKALFYFIPLEDSYRISLTVREQEREQLLKNNSMKTMHPMLQAAKKYPEGYALFFTILTPEDANDCLLLIGQLISMRR